MTGAGSATVARAPETTYGDPADPTEATWREPGIDIEVSELDVDNALDRRRYPDDPRPAGSGEGDFEGALGIAYTLTDDNFHEFVFADAGTALPSEAMRAPSATWYLGADILDGDEARTPTGAITTDCSWTYERGEDIRVEETILYGDEPDTVTAPDTIEQPSESDAYTWHGTDFQLDGATVDLLQSLTVSLSGLARFRRGQSRHPFDAVVDAMEPSVSLDAVLTTGDHRDIAYGGGTAPSDTLNSVTASLTFENGNGSTISYDLLDLDPSTYSWSDLVSAEDTTESLEFHMRTMEVV